MIMMKFRIVHNGLRYNPFEVFNSLFLLTKSNNIYNTLKLFTIHIHLFFSNLLLQNSSSPIMDAFAMTTTKVKPHHPTPMGQVYRILGLGLIPITTQNNKN
jgi:hypothetical protein